MGEGFNNQIIGGLTKLIRQAIQSPNFVSGSSGWTVNKDGSAEFNSITIRGKIIIQSSLGGIFVYRSTPAAGNLIFTVTNASGVDPYGNAYSSGVTVIGYEQSSGPNQINFLLANVAALLTQARMYAIYDNAGTYASLILQSG